MILRSVASQLSAFARRCRRLTDRAFFRTLSLAQPYFFRERMEGRVIRSDSSGPVTPRFPRFLFKFQWPKILLAPLTLVAVAMYTPRALAQSSPTQMLSAGVSENVNNVDV